MYSPVEVRICPKTHVRGTGRKRVRINPIVERTTLSTSLMGKPCYGYDHRRHTSDGYSSGSSTSRSKQRRRCSSRSKSSGRRRDPYFDGRESVSDAEIDFYSERYDDVHCDSGRHLPASTKISNARMSSPKKDRPLYDDDDYYMPRARGIRRATQHMQRPVPLYDNSKVLFSRRKHHFARGDSLTHKSLTRTYVFHRQPFDWYDTTQGVILEDIEQILEPEDPYEPVEIPPPPPPAPPLRSSFYEQFQPKVYYEPPVVEPAQRATTRHTYSNNGYSNEQCYDDYQYLYPSSFNQDQDTETTTSTRRSTPSLQKRVDYDAENDERVTAFRPIDAKNKSNKPKNYFVIEKQNSNSNGDNKSFKSTEFTSVCDDQDGQINGQTKQNSPDRSIKITNERDWNLNCNEETKYDYNEDINRIMKKFNDIGIKDGPK